MEEKRNLNWDGGSDPYYWSPSKEQSALIAAGCGVMMVVLAVAVLAANLLGLVS